ncbi:putative protein-S-isoprenylcysteine methyltransferase [Metapseudomonas furukawaii]|jgi:protein-S-isoprenylcysteine O-methyltransferase Ste14|uniref:Protein-S-isoprenylcysteine methyltransferase n=2 Tax=Metapseudomonas furukawaii TaxID=1149133 RepID=A0AAD1FIT5_METFU|nr:putative protein-S-isoprenylcysteine methyltransferase [Pseudomonas furukawaii]
MWLLSLWVPNDEVAAGWRIIASTLVLLAAAAVCLAGVLSFRLANTTVNPLKPETASSLVSSGVYRYTRNPMYLGFAVALVAWSIYLGSLVALLGVLGFVLYMNRFQIIPEEHALASLFREEFAAYRRRVRRWL